jgi:hypothetical protein
MWQQISNNPAFRQAFGANLSEDWFNSMPLETQENLKRTYAGGGVPSPMLDIKPQEVLPPQTATEPQVDNNQGFVPVTVNSGQSNSASLLYNPQTGGVRANGMAGEILLQNEKLAQELARGAYNQSLQQPVKEAAQKMATAEGILQNVPGDPSGDLINVYNNAKSGLAAAQASADQNYSAPDAPTMVDSRVLPQTTTPTLTGLEAQELTKPVLDITAPVEQPTTAPAAPVLTPSVVPDVDYSDPTLAPLPQNPVLVDTTQPAASPSAPATPTVSEPILRSGGQGRSTGALSAGSITSSSGPKTSNARGSMMPQMLIDRNEALIRIGGAMYSGALKGDGIGAATQEYGRIQDENREQSRKMAEAEQKRQMELAKLRARRAGGGKGGKKDGELLTATNAAMSNYQDALTAIRESRAAGGNLTGIGGIAKSLFDNFTGDDDAARRLILKRVKVDDALLRVAETKGAISNAEMKLFLDPAPKDWQDEAIWEQWIIDRMEALQRVQQRLSQGGTVPLNQRPTNQTSNPADFTIEEVKP